MVAIEQTSERAPLAGRSLTFEIESVSAAVEMVVSGKATRVSVSNLVHGDEVLTECSGSAMLRGVLLEPRRTPSRAVVEIRIRRA